MTNPLPGAFLWSDAWLLLAVGMATDAGSTTLPHVIGAADAVQHAIMTKEELDGGIARLVRAGYVRRTLDGLEPTPAGRELLGHAAKSGDTTAARQATVETLLGAASWSPGDDPRRARAGESQILTQEEYDNALRRYRRLASSRH